MIIRDAEDFISPIRTEEEHKKAVLRIIEILGAVEGSPEDRELDALVEGVSLRKNIGSIHRSLCIN